MTAETNGELWFEPEDFEIRHSAVPARSSELLTIELCAERANALLEERLEKCEKVYKAAGYGHHDSWLQNYDSLDGHPTHEAYLVHPRELK